MDGQPIAARALASAGPDPLAYHAAPDPSGVRSDRLARAGPEGRHAAAAADGRTVRVTRP